MKAKSANPRGEMPFLDHLEELRWRVLWSLLAIGVGCGVGFVLVLKLGVLQLLLDPLQSVMARLAEHNASFSGAAAEGKLNFISLTEPFFFLLKMGVVTGVILASPVVVYQVWAFLSPALEPKEKRIIIPSLYFGLLLFAAGVALAYFVALPVTIRFLLLFGEQYFTPILTAGPYLGFVIRLLLAFGLVFELPVVIMILSHLGLVTPEFLRSKRRHAIVGITILASALSPGDVLSVTFLLMLPLVILYEGSILLSKLVYRKKEERENRIDPPDESPEGAVEVGG